MPEDTMPEEMSETDPPALSGPRLAPASRRMAAQLVILLHGYGAGGSDLIALGREWSASLPDAAFIAPEAPYPCAIAASGREWFPLTRLDPDELGAGVRMAAPVLERFIDDALSRHGLGPADLALVGFSQGAMMALHVGLRMARPPAAIIGYSGALAAPERLEDEITAKPPVLLVHGREDDVIRPAALHLAAGALGAAGVGVEWHVREKLGHGIDPAGMRLGAEFLISGFGAARAG